MKSMPKKILIFSDWFAPGFKAGGPIRSLINITSTWPFESYVFCGDRDLGDTQPYSDITQDSWLTFNDRTMVYYQSPKSRSWRNVQAVIRSESWDGYYFNSLFSVWFTILPLLYLKITGNLQKATLAPRGMFHLAAYSQKKWKKSIFVFCAKNLGLWNGITWHATSELEAERIKLIVGKNARIVSLSNVPNFKRRSAVPKWNMQRQNWLMVTRISPEKGVWEGIKWLGESDFWNKVELQIVGPIENQDYHERCLQLLREYPGLTVVFHGDVPFESLSEFRNKAHVFYSATKGENFGHAIAESILAGLPVIISNQTPWLELEEKGVGYDVDWNQWSFQEAFHKWFSQDEDQYLLREMKMKLFRENWIKDHLEAVKWNDLFRF